MAAQIRIRARSIPEAKRRWEGAQMLGASNIEIHAGGIWIDDKEHHAFLTARCLPILSMGNKYAVIKDEDGAFKARPEPDKYSPGYILITITE